MNSIKYDPHWKRRFWRDFLEPLCTHAFWWALSAIVGVVLLFVLLFLGSLVG